MNLRPSPLAAVASGALLALAPSSFAQELPPTPAPVPPAAAAPVPPPITVTVNGEPVVFASQAPVEQGGTILVPLRGVFEKLGAGVQYTAATKTITAVRGVTTVTLRLGDANAYVNGEARPLAVVPQALNGVTVVPLRFVSEALGAQVAWKRDILTVVITTGAPVADQLPTPEGTDPVFGTVTGLLPETSSVTVRLPGGVNNRIALDSAASLLVKSSDEGPEEAQPLTSLKPGDQVTITRNDQAQGIVLRVRTDQRRGFLKSVTALPDGGATITLTDGSVVEVVNGAPVSMAGRRIALREVQEAENLVIRLDQVSKKGIGIAVATDDDPNPIPPIKVEASSVTQ
ncbi:MAG: copper amine oxidase N-terminal domain-containing protein, partial [Armatimonadota bacterium]